MKTDSSTQDHRAAPVDSEAKKGLGNQPAVPPTPKGEPARAPSRRKTGSTTTTGPAPAATGSAPVAGSGGESILRLPVVPVERKIVDGRVIYAPADGSPTLVSIVPFGTSPAQGATKQSGEAELVTDAMPAYWVERINRAVEKTARSVVEIGQEVLAAQAKLKHGEWLKMFKPGQVTLKLRAAQKFMQVANNPALANAANLALLPPSPTALVALSTLPAKVVEDGIKEGHISPGMTIAAAGKFVREHLPEPGGDKGAEDASTQQPGKASVRNEFLSVLWDDSDAPPTRAPEKSYGSKTYPNITFFRFHAAGDTQIESGSKHGLTHIAHFAVPVEPTELIKDKAGRPFCKASFRFLTLSVRGDVPEPATVPSQIVDDDFAGVVKMIHSMFPDALKVLSSAEHEAPPGWQYVPRQSSADGKANDSSPAPDSTEHPEGVGGDPTSSLSGSAHLHGAADGMAAKAKAHQLTRKAKLNTVRDHVSKLHDGLGAIAAQLRQFQEKAPEIFRRRDRYKARREAIVTLEVVTKRLAGVVASLGVPGDINPDGSACVGDLQFKTKIVPRGSRLKRVQRMTEIIVAIAKSIQKSAPTVAKVLEDMARELERLVERARSGSGL